MGRLGVIVIVLIAACGGGAADDPCIEEVELTPCRWSGVVGVCVEGVCTPSSCGNGIVEPGEACDDANPNGNNGCRTDCTPPACSDGILDASEECDDSNKRSGDGCAPDCRLEAATWLLVENRPSARSGAAMGYDAGRGVTVMIGGQDAVSGFEDTWEWDGVQWTRRSERGAPRGRKLVFDPRTGKLLAFGIDLGRIHELVGREWREIFITATTTPAGEAAVAWSGTRNTVVAVLGDETNGMAAFELEWNRFGSGRYEWNRRLFDSPLVPSRRQNHALVGDPVRGPVILFSGGPRLSPNVLDDAWTLDGNGWSQLPSSGAPTAYATGVFDPVTGKALFYDGTTLLSWDGATWARIDAPGAPSRRRDVGVTYDLRRHELVVFGGVISDGSVNNGSISDETYTFDGAWHLRQPAPNVIEMPGATAAWDAARGAGLIVGQKTWQWNGSFAEVPGPGPMPRTRPALAALRDRLVLTGGAASADTWEWTGAWQQVATTGAPPLGSAAMAPDPQGLVLYGGGETWLWRGGTWARSPATSPTMTGGALTYHPIRMRTVLSGAAGTWEWDGTEWSASAATGSPSDGTVYDGWHRGVVALAARRAAVYGAAAWRAIPFSQAGPTAPPAAMFYDTIQRAVIYLETDFLRIRAWELRYDPISRETCSAMADGDLDGLVGCKDPDCWGRCAPFCPPGTTCDDTLPHCGDGVCNPALESCELCPQDCHCPTLCGDLRCDPGEQCIGDC